MDFDAPNLDAGKESQTVVVTGQKATLDTLPQKILDTPQSINVVTSELIEQQGGNSLADALKNVPGITLNAGEGGTHGDLVNLRGFSAGDDYFMDGLRDTGLYDRDSFDYDNVEVYKGPASTLFGRGSTGGVINQVLKAPELHSFSTFSATGGTNSEARATADVNIPFSDHAAARINVMGQRNLTEGRPFTKTQRWGVAPAVAFGIDTDTTGSLKYLHLTSTAARWNIRSCSVSNMTTKWDLPESAFTVRFRTPRTTRPTCGPTMISTSD